MVSLDEHTGATATRRAQSKQYRDAGQPVPAAYRARTIRTGITRATVADFAREVIDDPDVSRQLDGKDEKTTEFRQAVSEINRERTMRGMSLYEIKPNTGFRCETDVAFEAIQAALLNAMRRGVNVLTVSDALQELKYHFPWIPTPQRFADDLAEREAQDWADSEGFGMDDDDSFDPETFCVDETSSDAQVPDIFGGVVSPAFPALPPAPPIAPPIARPVQDDPPAVSRPAVKAEGVASVVPPSPVAESLVERVAAIARAEEAAHRNIPVDPTNKSTPNDPPPPDDPPDDDPGGDDLRPETMGQFIGQARIKTVLEAAIRGARTRKHVLDHILLAGPAGLGKTTLAKIVAGELKRKAVTTSGPALDRDALYEFLTSLNPGDVFFIDEIHRLPAPVAELLYPAMEDFEFDLPGIPRQELPPFTLIGATTDPGRLPGPFRDRFGIVERLDYYGVPDLVRVVRRSARILGVPVTPGGAREIAKRAKDTPRIANRILARARDFLTSGEIDEPMVARVCDALAIDGQGLDATDRLYLDALKRKFKGGPVGLKTLARAIGAETRTLEDMIEPYLIRMGKVVITQRGRTAT